MTTTFIWAVILGLIAALLETHKMTEAAIVFATLCGVVLVYLLWEVMNSI